ncbi:MAG: DUF1848 family protein [Ruthenibacterium lactatiformans]
MDTFLRLSERLGPEGVDWRLTRCFLLLHHSRVVLERFGALCRALHGATQCVFSLRTHIRAFVRPSPVGGNADALLARFADIAGEYGLPRTPVPGCGAFRIRHPARGVHRQRESGAYRRVSHPGAGSRPAPARHAASVDIGVYNTCPNGCTYCYATTRPALLRRPRRPCTRPMLTGWPRGGEQITDRTGPAACGTGVVV